MKTVLQWNSSIAIAALVCLLVEAQSFVPADHQLFRRGTTGSQTPPHEDAMAQRHLLFMFNGGGKGQPWWNQSHKKYKKKSRNNTNNNSTETSAAVIEKEEVEEAEIVLDHLGDHDDDSDEVEEDTKPDDSWIIEGFENASKDIIDSYHDETQVLKDALLQMMDKLEETYKAVDNSDERWDSLFQIQQDQMEALVVQATSDLVESIENLTELETVSSVKQDTQQESLRLMEKRMNDIQKTLDKQTTAMQAQIRQKQIHFAIDKAERFAFKYQEDGQSKMSTTLVEETLFLFLRNYGLIVPPYAMVQEAPLAEVNLNQHRYGMGQRFGYTSGNDVLVEDDDDTKQELKKKKEQQDEKAREAFRTKFVEQLEMLLGEKPEIKKEDGTYIIRLSKIDG